MTERCELCQRDFDSAEALQMHHRAKHEPVKAGLTSASKKKIRNWIIVLVVLGLVVLGVRSWIQSNQATNDTIPDFDVPSGPIHWHPHLTIRIDGQDLLIPKDIGLGRVHQPIHTHETDGILHLENNRPTKQNVILGFFFKVWDKKFSRECIFDYCTDKGTLKMYVNGVENFDYQNYFLQDKDEILIEYTSFARGGSNGTN